MGWSEFIRIAHEKKAGETANNGLKIIERLTEKPQKALARSMRILPVDHISKKVLQSG